MGIALGGGAHLAVTRSVRAVVEGDAFAAPLEGFWFVEGGPGNGPIPGPGHAAVGVVLDLLVAGLHDGVRSGLTDDARRAIEVPPHAGIVGHVALDIVGVVPGMVVRGLTDLSGDGGGGEPIQPVVLKILLDALRPVEAGGDVVDEIIGVAEVPDGQCGAKTA